MLSFEGLRIEQGDFRLCADLSLPAGAQVAVMGPSGAGKSTLLSVLAGFVAPVAGRITWQGSDLAALAPGARPITMIFQDNNLFPHLTVHENIALGLRPSGRLTQPETLVVTDALSRVGLDGMGGRKPATLSGGQQSRVALARMLVQSRPLVLLDEPFSALGPAMRGEMVDLVAGLCRERGATLLMVTHDPGDAARLAGDLCVVADGVVTPPRPVAELLADPPAALRAYLGLVP